MIKKNKQTKKKNTGTAAAKECSVDPAVVEVLQELLGIFTKKEQRNGLKAFLSGDIFALLTNSFGTSLIKRCNAWQHTTGQ